MLDDLKKKSIFLTDYGLSFREKSYQTDAHKCSGILGSENSLIFSDAIFLETPFICKKPLKCRELYR